MHVLLRISIICFCFHVFLFCYSNLNASILQLCYSVGVTVFIVAVNNFHQQFIVVENLVTLSFIALLLSLRQCCIPLLLLERDARLIIYRIMDS